ncbi:uncharacterized protein LOC129791688 isoform X1 [Lutzomyia longipalpis]|uniref:uncharacterized protein LOC129791688 isoform X1 n=1 Tax=Lutzomyia longipalpis TaxID=7200 RepID=UPI0024833307|nr:uncharacterized protein LOC129791688 isoform X1 [Lutzomyia longipalpis]XP_055685947.1 uncharacterized protein LOC129791688 isoform X1 [Lutzomyia longipalpis]
MPLFNKCCCCISLPTGGVILGVLGVISSLFAIVLPVFGLVYLDVLFDAAKQAREDAARDAATGILVGNMTENSEFDGVTDEQLDLARLLLTIIFIIMIIVNIFVLISAILLIIGAKRKRREFILPYLITDAFGIAFTLLYFINNAANGVNLGQTIVSAIIYFFLAGYLWLCVFSLYQWIKESSRPTPTVRHHYPEQQAVYSTMA